MVDVPSKLFEDAYGFVKQHRKRILIGTGIAAISAIGVWLLFKKIMRQSMAAAMNGWMQRAMVDGINLWSKSKPDNMNIGHVTVDHSIFPPKMHAVIEYTPVGATQEYYFSHG